MGVDKLNNIISYKLNHRHVFRFNHFLISLLVLMTISVKAQYRNLSMKHSSFNDNDSDTTSLKISHFLKKGKPRDALALLQKSAELMPPVNDHQRADISELFGNCYEDLREYIVAEKYYLEMIRLCDGLYGKSKNEKKSIDLFYFIHSHETMARFHIYFQFYKKADLYLNKILSIPRATLSSANLSAVYFMKFQIDSARGNYVAAQNDFIKHKNLDDSIFNRVKSNQIEDMQVKYETAKKTHDKQLLQAKHELQTEELKKLKSSSKLYLCLNFGLNSISSIRLQPVSF